MRAELAYRQPDNAFREEPQMINRTLRTLSATLLVAAVTLPSLAQAQVAGGTVIGVTESVQAAVAAGWSVKKSILGKDVYNDDTKPGVVGKVEDVIVNPVGSVSYAVVNASKYLGMSSHLELVPQILHGLRDAGAGELPVVVGGIIPAADETRLLQEGVASVFTPKDHDLTAAMAVIVDTIRSANGLAPLARSGEESRERVEA